MRNSFLLVCKCGISIEVEITQESVFNLVLFSFKRGLLRSCRQAHGKTCVKIRCLKCTARVALSANKKVSIRHSPSKRVYYYRRTELGTAHFKPFSACLLSHVNFRGIVTKLFNLQPR